MEERKLKFEELPEVNSPRWLSKEDLEGEEWRDVVGYEGLYMVSDYGRVKSLDRLVVYRDKQKHKHLHPSKILHAFINRHGYCVVHLCAQDNRHGATKTVHQMVLAAFDNRPEGCDQINHKDETKHNNCFYNLEYCDRWYNINYGTAKERAKQTRIKYKIGFVPVLCYTTKGDFVAEYDSLDIAAKSLCETSNHISEVCYHKAKTYCGYYWIQKGWNFEEWLSEHKKRFKDKEVKLRQYSLEFEKIAEYDSILEAELKTGARHVSVCSKRRPGRLIAGGFIWLRENDTIQDWYREAMPELKAKHPRVYKKLLNNAQKKGLC